VEHQADLIGWSTRKEHANLWSDYATVATTSSAFRGGIAPAEGIFEHVIQHGSAHLKKGCTAILFQRICCFLFIRLATISLTALSTNAVEIGSPCCRRAA
jgi:hypothetical protein